MYAFCQITQPVSYPLLLSAKGLYLPQRQLILPNKQLVLPDQFSPAQRALLGR